MWKGEGFLGNREKGIGKKSVALATESPRFCQRQNHPPLTSNVIKLRGTRLHRNVGSSFFIIIWKKHLTNRQKCAAFLLSADNKKALVIRSVPALNYKEVCKVLDRIKLVKRKMDESLAELCALSQLFAKQPGRDFSRVRKLSFSKVISFLLAMEGKTLTAELLNQFGCFPDTASAAALVQQRSKIIPEAFSTLFCFFVQKTQPFQFFKGFRLFAADGSDIQIPNNPEHARSHYPGINGQSPYNLLHLDALYDLCQHTYQDASLVADRDANEAAALCRMVDRSPVEKAIVIADRGYEGYNLLAHIQEKGWKFLIRTKDIGKSGGIASGLQLPDAEEFDLFVDLSLTKKQTNEVMEKCRRKNEFRRIPSNTNFDYLPKTNRKHNPAVFYHLPFRFVRFKISEGIYETVVTNLDPEDFPPHVLRELYAMRWGIETSFRELKYTVGLLHFHAKKVEHIYQEVFARLIMYNFTELITSPVISHKADCKYAYRANFTAAVHVCRQFFLGNVSPPNVEAVIRRNISPIRPGRSKPRNFTAKRPVSFTYRIA